MLRDNSVEHCRNIYDWGQTKSSNFFIARETQNMPTFGQDGQNLRNSGQYTLNLAWKWPQNMTRPCPTVMHVIEPPELFENAI